MDIDHIRTMWQQNDVVFTNHFRDRLEDRQISLAQVEQALLNGMIIEERPDAIPHAQCTIQGDVSRDLAGLHVVVPLYVVCALGTALVLITVDWNPPRSLGQRQGGRRR